MPLLDSIREALARVVLKLRQHHDLYARNETAVREHLILPVLRALGWDIESPDDVHPELRNATGSADYTLKLRGASMVTVEVKNGSKDVAEPGALEQAHRYASASGIKLCMATNGSVWVLARSFEEGKDLRGRIIWQALLSDNSVDSVASKLALIAKESIEHIDGMIKLQDLLSELWEEMLSEPTELVGVLVELLKAKLPSDVQQIPYPSFIEDYVDQRVREILAASDTRETGATGGDGGQLPPGGDPLPSQKSIATILQEAAERAIREGRLRTNDQITTGRRRYLVSPQAIHQNGREFFSPRSLSNGMFLETHCSNQTARRHVELLNKWNQDRSRRRN